MSADSHQPDHATRRPSAEGDGESFTTLTDTKDAFVHLAQRARERLVIMTPFIDAAGADWAADIFEVTSAQSKHLVLRDSNQLDACGTAALRVRSIATHIHDYSIVQQESFSSVETFHAKIVLADGIAAYVGSANFLYRSRETNLECGFLLEGDAVAPVAVLVDAVLNIFKPGKNN